VNVFCGMFGTETNRTQIMLSNLWSVRTISTPRTLHLIVS